MTYKTDYGLFEAIEGDGKTSLFKTASKYGPYDEPQFLQLWNGSVNDNLASINEQVALEDWSRWNTELPEGQKVEISESIYYHLLNCLPPRNWHKTYFEVGEAHHHTNEGRAIHRACWIENDKYYTGYPKPQFR